MKVRDIMSTEVVTLSPETEIAEAARVLLEKRINGVPVVNETGRVVGILCQSDLVSQQKKFPLPSVFTLLDSLIPLKSVKNLDREVQKMTATRVSDAMTPNPVTVGPEHSVEDVASLMVDKKFHTIPVVEEGKLIGIVGKEDVLRILTRE